MYQQTPPGPQGYRLDASEIRHPKAQITLYITWGIALVGLIFLIFVSNASVWGKLLLTAVGTSIFFNFLSSFQAVGNMLLVTEHQFPEIYEAARVAAARLDMQPLPIYIYEHPELEAATVWNVKGYHIKFSSALVDAMETAELQFIIGQRMAVAKLGAGPMQLITGQGTDVISGGLSGAAAKLPGLMGQTAEILSLPAKKLFVFWQRYMSYAYLRGGLIACQDIRTGMTALVKQLVGPHLFPYTNLPVLLDQAQQLDSQLGSKLAEAVGGMTESMFINQIRELLRWYRSPEYQQIAARQGKMGTSTLAYAAGGTSNLFASVAAQAQARKGYFSSEWDQVLAAQPVPPGYKLRAYEFRHEQELLILAVTWLGGVALILLGGAFSNLFLLLGAAFVPLYFMQYFELVSSYGTMVKVTPQQFPGLYNLLQEAAGRLNMPMPDTFIKQSAVRNAFAVWLFPLKPRVIIHTGLIENYSPRELQFVIGHEYGHIKAAHTPLTVFFKIGPGRTTLSRALGPVSALIKYWFAWWTRSGEQTADRAGLIATQDIRVTVAGILKLATGGKGVWNEMNLPAFIAQLEEMDKEPLHRLVQTMTERSHPLALFRAREIIRFYKSPKFQAIRAKVGAPQTGTLPQFAAGGTSMLLNAVAHQVQSSKDAMRAPVQPAAPVQPPVQPAPSPVAQTGACPACGGANRPGARFCGHCGHTIS